MLTKPDRISLVGEYIDLQALKALTYLYDCPATAGDPCLNTTNCCCSPCVEFYGYLKYVKDSDKPVYDAAFDEKTGFLGESGCRLPRELRSATCLAHLCGEAKEKKDPAIRPGLHVIRKVMLSLEKTVEDTEVRD